jgi:hypothetical protein
MLQCGARSGIARASHQFGGETTPAADFELNAFWQELKRV